ncbi:hypothetical protein EJB05_14339, partial [Eragrostis curvula]
MAPPPPELIEDVTAEILLPLPPDEPEHLVRALLVCKPWLRLISDPGFLRRYRAFHGTPPLLGLLYRLRVISGKNNPRLAPTTAVPLFPYTNLWWSDVLDCRHGRVLLLVMERDWYFVVWDPVTGEQQRLPDIGIPWLIYTAVVICAVSCCDHLDCHGGPFRVFLLSSTTKHDKRIKASVYSSESGAWRVTVCLSESCLPPRSTVIQPRRVALIGDDIYFTRPEDNAIIKYELSKNCLSMINPPSPNVSDSYTTLMVMEDGSLGFACLKSFSLYLWSRKVNSKRAAKWIQCRVIELDGMVPIANPDDRALVVDFAEGVGAIFVRTCVGLFMIKLSSGRVRMVGGPGFYFCVIPYMSFYTPGCGTLS